MSMNDPLGDMLTRIRNAQMRGKSTVSSPASKLRAWVLASGTAEPNGYLLGLDPHAPDTHSTLASALMRVGIAPTLIGTRGHHPALRISGRRRLLRLVENVGEPPGFTEAFLQWPRI